MSVLIQDTARNTLPGWTVRGINQGNALGAVERGLAAVAFGVAQPVLKLVLAR